MLRNNILRTGVAAAALALVGAANASTIYGGGSTLAQPFYNVIFGLMNSASPSNAATFSTYGGMGSGGGRTEFETNIANTTYNANGVSIAYGASDAYMTTAGVNNTSEAANWTTGFTIAASKLGNPAYTTNTVIPAQQPIAGNLIQLPLLGTPIAMAYDIKAIAVAGLNYYFPSITLTDSDICGIYSGKITSWAGVSSIAATIAAYPKKFNATTPFAPLSVAIRSDSSGTTFLFTQHLQKVCNAGNSNFNMANFTAPVSVWTGSLFNSGVIPANFQTESGNGGVANYMDGGNATTHTTLAPKNAIAYISPDYTWLTPGQANHTWLPVAKVINATSGIAYLPTIANTQLALANPGAGSTNAVMPSTRATALVQANWVPAMPTPSAGYPMVGYTNMLVAQCYADNNVALTLKSFLTNLYSGVYAAQIKTAGFSPVAWAVGKNVTGVFLTNARGYSPSLAIQAATLCKSATGAGLKATIVGR
jgi:phosphate transport system substrate-binding protein